MVLSLLPSVLAVATAGYIAYLFFIHPFFSSPLRHIPRAHWSVPFPYVGSLWILYQRWKSRNNAVTYRAHQTHGEIVRLGYNELSVSCVDNGIRTIYGGGWEKHEWYPRQFAGYDVINMFSTVHHTPHSQKKRIMSNIYSKSFLQTCAQLRVNSHHLVTTRFLPFVQAAAESGEPTDVHEMNNSFTMDFMTAYQFGISQSTNFTQDVDMRRKYLGLYHSRREWEFHSAEIPPQLHRALAYFKIRLRPAWVAFANEWLEDWCTRTCAAADACIARMDTAASPSSEKSHDSADINLGDEPLVYKQFRVGMDKLREKDANAGREILPHIADTTHFLSSPAGLAEMKQRELQSEMLDHLGAGHETSAIALTYLQYELSKNRALQDRLHAELTSGDLLSPVIKWPPPPPPPKTKSLTDFELPEPKSLDALPVLQAVLMETLRLHAPIPGMEPRVSPAPAPATGGHQLGAFSGIPGGVRVSSMPYTLHRNASVFPSPERFIPNRWLSSSTYPSLADTSSEAQLKEMHRWFWAFGSGGRMCIGSHLAIQEIKLIVAAIYSNYTTEVVDDDGVEELDAYTTRPSSNRLMLRFVPR